MLVGCCRPCPQVLLNVWPGPTVRGVLSGWLAYRHVCLDQTPSETLTLKTGQYKYTGTMPLNIPSSPDPFPLGPHALPLELLDRVCTQAGPTS